jgi:hypothetical protein
MILVLCTFSLSIQGFFQIIDRHYGIPYHPHHHVKRTDTYIENRNNRPCNQVDQHLGNKTKEEVDKWYDIIEDQSMMNSMT